jgi:hypothetical protein
MLKRALAALVCLPTVTLAQDAVGVGSEVRDLRGDPLVSTHQHWAAFQAGDESACYAATLADDRKTYLKVTDPEREGGGGHVVSLLFGDPSQRRSEATLVVDDQHQFSMISNGEAAWFTNGEAEEQARVAIAQGSRAEAIYVTAEGNPLRIRFSLRGATAATRAAREACR